MRPSTFRRSNRAAGKAPRLPNGFRSGLEKRVADDLDSRGTPYRYEKVKISYTVPERLATYTPDFVLGNGVIVEAKGLFDTEDRAKHLLIQKQHPELDIRFVFSRGQQPIYKGSPTTHGGWCEKHGFKWAEKLVPPSWAKETPNNGTPTDDVCGG